MLLLLLDLSGRACITSSLVLTAEQRIQQMDGILSAHCAAYNNLGTTIYIKLLLNFDKYNLTDFSLTDNKNFSVFMNQNQKLFKTIMK